MVLAVIRRSPPAAALLWLLTLAACADDPAPTPTGTDTGTDAQSAADGSADSPDSTDPDPDSSPDPDVDPAEDTTPDTLPETDTSADTDAADPTDTVADVEQPDTTPPQDTVDADTVEIEDTTDTTDVTNVADIADAADSSTDDTTGDTVADTAPDIAPDIAEECNYLDLGIVIVDCDGGYRYLRTWSDFELGAELCPLYYTITGDDARWASADEALESKVCTDTCAWSASNSVSWLRCGRRGGYILYRAADESCGVLYELPEGLFTSLDEYNAAYPCDEP